MKNLLLSLTFLAIASPSWGLGVANGVVTTSKLGGGSVTTSKLHIEALVDVTKDGAFSRLGVNTILKEANLHVVGDDGLATSVSCAGLTACLEEDAGVLVGIKTTVNSAARLFLGDGTNSAGLDFTWDANASPPGLISLNDTGADLKIVSGNADGAYIYLDGAADGNVGIGIAAPTAELHISGGTATSAKVTIGEATVAACMMYRDTDLAGWTEVGYLNGAIAYTTVDADGVCDGA